MTLFEYQNREIFMAEDQGMNKLSSTLTCLEKDRKSLSR